MSKTLIALALKVEESDVLNAKEAAQLLGIQHTSALKAAERETLKGHKIGSMWFFTRAEVERYIRGRK